MAYVTEAYARSILGTEQVAVLTDNEDQGLFDGHAAAATSVIKGILRKRGYSVPTDAEVTGGTITGDTDGADAILLRSATLGYMIVTFYGRRGLEMTPEYAAALSIWRSMDKGTIQLVNLTPAAKGAKHGGQIINRGTSTAVFGTLRDDI